MLGIEFNTKQRHSLLTWWKANNINTHKWQIPPHMHANTNQNNVRKLVSIVTKGIHAICHWICKLLIQIPESVLVTFVVIMQHIWSNAYLHNTYPINAYMDCHFINIITSFNFYNALLLRERKEFFAVQHFLFISKVDLVIWLYPTE